MSVKVKLVKIGNSRGIRIPKGLLEQVGFEEDVQLEATRNSIVIRPAALPRAGWEQAFEEMANRSDDQLLDRETVEKETAWERAEWEWK